MTANTTDLLALCLAFLPAATPQNWMTQWSLAPAIVIPLMLMAGALRARVAAGAQPALRARADGIRDPGAWRWYRRFAGSQQHSHQCICCNSYCFQIVAPANYCCNLAARSHLL